MIIKRVSMLSGKTHERDIQVTEEQLDLFENGVLVQNAFPHLNASDREFIMTGVTDEEWDSAFGKPE